MPLPGPARPGPVRSGRPTDSVVGRYFPPSHRPESKEKAGGAGTAGPWDPGTAVCLHLWPRAASSRPMPMSGIGFASEELAG